MQLLQERGAVVTVHDPMYSDDEIRGLGFEPAHTGDVADGLVLQADHPEYIAFDTSTFPGVRALVDGRNLTDASKWQGVTRVVIGGGE